MHFSAFGRILQCIGYDVFQDGIHLILIQPDVQIAEVAFISQGDMFYGCIRAEGVDDVGHVSLQLVFGYVEIV